mmetsp:Transcript_17409/g.27816  ORF Transcript_17409/g.27816 Transcript_17409/m.27816 type:complete len:320 (+) Transcript_17409:129-1088(+)
MEQKDEDFFFTNLKDFPEANENRGGNEVSKAKANNLVMEFRKQLGKSIFYGLPGTNGTFESTYWERLRQESIIWSLYAADSLHPFSKIKRVIWFILCTSFLFFMTLAISRKITNPSVGYSVLRGFVILATITPTKFLLRHAMECSCCIWSTKCEQSCKKAGWLVVIPFALGCPAFIVLGIIWSVQTGGDIGLHWFVTQIIYICFGDPLEHLILQWIFFGSQKNYFVKRYSIFFPDDEPPISLTDVARMLQLKYGPMSTEVLSAEIWCQKFRLNDDVKTDNAPLVWRNIKNYLLKWQTSTLKPPFLHMQSNSIEEKHTCP